MQSADLLCEKTGRFSSTSGRHHKDPPANNSASTRSSRHRSTMRTKARRVAFAIRSASSGLRRARERSGESRWISAAWTKRYVAILPSLVRNVSRSNQSHPWRLPTLKCSIKPCSCGGSRIVTLRAPDHGSWLLQLAIRNRAIEFRQVATVQVPAQIFRGEIGRSPDLLHLRPVSVRRTRSARSWHR